MPSEHHTTISTKTILQVIMAGVLLLVLWKLRSLVLILLTAIVVSSFIETFVGKMKKVGIGRTLAVVIFFLLAFFILAAIFYLFVPVFLSELISLGPTIAKYMPT